MSDYLYEKHNGAFSDLVSGKRIALVGPAPYTETAYLKNKIESYDLVVRLNKSFPVPENMQEHIGSRTDIHYVVSHWLNRQQETYLKQAQEAGIKFISVSFPRVSRCKWIKKHVGDIGYKEVSALNFARFIAILKARPSTGNMAILDLLSYPIRELFICGLTFYRDGFYYGNYTDNPRVNKTLRNHEPATQRLQMLRIFNKDPRVVIEETMKSIILG